MLVHLTEDDAYRPVGPPPNIGVMFIRKQGQVLNHRTNLVTRDDPLEIGAERVAVRGAPSLCQDLDHLVAPAFKQVFCLGPALGWCVLQNRARSDRCEVTIRPARCPADDPIVSRSLCRWKGQRHQAFRQHNAVARRHRRVRFRKHCWKLTDDVVRIRSCRNA